MKVEQICRDHGISSATYYNWKSKYGRIEAADVKWKTLEEENNRLKKMYAEVTLAHQAVKDRIVKEGW